MNQRSVQIKFVGHEIQKGIVVYKIQLYDTRDSSQWNMQNRYSTMREIHNQLKKEHPDKIPEFPPKKWFGNMDEKFINQREKALENYFSNCLKAISVDSSKTIRDFLFKNKQNSPVIVDQNTAYQPSTSQNTIQNQPQPVQKVNVNPQQVFNDQMVKIVQSVPFIDFVPFVSPEHNNQDYKRNVYNQITFERKSKLLQNFQLPSCQTDYSEQAKHAQPVNVQFGRKLDMFAEKINRTLESHLSNIPCDIVSKANFV